MSREIISKISGAHRSTALVPIVSTVAVASIERLFMAMAQKLETIAVVKPEDLHSFVSPSTLNSVSFLAVARLSSRQHHAQARPKL